MNLKDIISISKEFLFVSQKDGIVRRYLSTKNKNYQYILSCIDRKEFDENLLIDEPIIQEFAFQEILKLNDDNISTKVYKFEFCNISIGSSHFRDFHDFDLQVISKLSMLEFLSRSKMAQNLFRDFKAAEKKLELKQLDYSVILKKDKELSGSHIKIPFIFAIVIDRIRRTAIDTKEIFRKSIRLTSQAEYFKDIHRLLNTESNNILNIYNSVKTAEPLLLCSTLKMLLQTFNPLFPVGVLKFLCSIPSIQDPQLTVLLYQCLMLQIPDLERNILETVIDLLAYVTQYKDKNDICLTAVARLFTPVLLNPTCDFVNSSIEVLIQMVHYRKLIFLIPHNVINVYRNYDMDNRSEIQKKKNIGKKSFFDNSEKSVELIEFKHLLSGGPVQEENIAKSASQDIFEFKYKRSKLTMIPTEKTIIQDVLNKVTENKSINSDIDLRLFESNGNIHQLCLHPDMQLFKAIDANFSAKFFVESAPEYDLVKSTMKALFLCLNIDE